MSSHSDSKKSPPSWNTSTALSILKLPNGNNLSLMFQIDQIKTHSYKTTQITAYDFNQTHTHRLITISHIRNSHTDTHNTQMMFCFCNSVNFFHNFFDSWSVQSSKKLGNITDCVIAYFCLFF